jgi:AGCS family alanine or glycine:cation symporter
MIFKYAFAPQAIIGGGFGAAIKTAISQGAKRGLFSNEAGMGSTPHAHALAHVKDPHEQGIVAMIGVFIDTFVVLTLNALVIISTLYTDDGILFTGVIPEGVGKGNLAQLAFGSVMGESFGAVFVAVCLFFFAFSTVLSWNLFGRVNVRYLFARNGKNSSDIIYSIIALAFIFMGTLVSNDFVWELTDMFNNLMVIPNAIALFALTSVVIGIASAHMKNRE